MPKLVDPVIADPDDIEAQIECFKAHGYVILPDLLSPDEVGTLNDAIDRDRETNPFMWFSGTSPDYNCNLLLTEPAFEMTIRHERLLPLIGELMGGPICFEELAVRHRGSEDEAHDTGWHRDRGYWPQHPLNLDYPQVIYYLNDVNETTHCFSISPEPTTKTHTLNAVVSSISTAAQVRQSFSTVLLYTA
ncbi:phytanoyl-CoA dioxygenase family protein [Candidatus Poribacteria bacterium]|nr:phytanoyl-CoA dioxygenase family protein [Candidatus Poribacteria bacterium]